MRNKEQQYVFNVQRATVPPEPQFLIFNDYHTHYFSFSTQWNSIQGQEQTFCKVLSQLALKLYSVL